MVAILISKFQIMPKKLIKHFYCICLLSLLFSFKTTGQSNSDILLIANKPILDSVELKYYKYNGNDVKFINLSNKKSYIKYNPIAYALASALFLYQNILSKQLSKTCPYHTTCSNFCKKAIVQHGLLMGIFLTADRLSRCNRVALLDVLSANMLQDGSIKDDYITEEL